MNALLSLGGWSVIPDLATRHTLQFIYSTPLLHRTLRLKPSAPNTPTYRRHYGILFAVVVLGYLLYTLVEKAVNAPENFYETLGVGPGVDEGGLKLAFRQFAKKYHPDRVGKGGEEKFMEVRKLVEALKNPTVRFAYDRFGPDVLKWKGQCTTTGEYLWRGLLQSAGYHIASLAFLLFWSVVGRSTPFTFWRYILYFTLLTLELRLILSPSPSPSGRHITLLHRLFPNRVIYQHILFLHQVFMFLNVALMRVTPHLIERDELNDPRMEAALVERTVALVNLADRETSKMVHTELQSIAPSDDDTLTVGLASTPHHPSFARPEPVNPATATALLNELAPEVERLIIENNLKQRAGPLKTAWEAAVRRVWRGRVDEVGEREAREVRERDEWEQERRVQREEEEYEGAKERDRERTPTPTSPVPLPSLNPLTPAPSLSNVNGVIIKQEEADFATLPPLPKSPSPGLDLPSTPTHPPTTPPNPTHPHHLHRYVSRSPFRSSRFNSTTTPFSTPLPSAYSPSTPGSTGTGITTPRSKLKSVPRTPGELPSPRPSPSPPPSPFPRRGGVGVGGYFAKGTAYEEEEMERSAERIRARSLSC
ncbi:hypothetical protein FA13DRAFT_1681484 [Coprinellus micaceus]|uniref:J domain-containing protein n=1 Tax=Coprinellus micaceus TaxID=71717 RepID=A0A4Y7TVY8_COPMI|nr:hypothetical protein FA13DRAFT_1681484 [Coprinellus micaceus]